MVLINSSLVVEKVRRKIIPLVRLDSDLILDSDLVLSRKDSTMDGMGGPFIESAEKATIDELVFLGVMISSMESAPVIALMLESHLEGVYKLDRLSGVARTMGFAGTVLDGLTDASRDVITLS